MRTPGCSRWRAPPKAARAQRRASRLRRAFRELMTRRGADLRYGRTLPGTLREAGLAGVAAAGSFPVGGAVCDRLEIATMRQVRAELVAARLAGEAEIDAPRGEELTATSSPPTDRCNRSTLTLFFR
jgi:hypothetical protein